MSDVKWWAFSAAVCAASVLAACGGTESSEPPPAAVPIENPVDPETAAAIGGIITFEGVPPPAQPINMRSDPYCERENPGATRQTVRVNGEGGLQHVFVYVKDGLGDLRFPVPGEPVVLDQRACTYEPRVFGIQVGQTLEIRNSDDTLHNIYARAAVNHEFNKGQAERGQVDTHVFSTREVMLPFRCDVHRWMNAWMGVLDHPYHAVTAADGRFRIGDLPPGTYTIEAWHETLGTQTQTVTVGARETRDIAFTFAAS